MSPALNWRIGWVLLLAGFLWAVFLDADIKPGVERQHMLQRHAQAVVLAMGFLQLAAALILSNPLLLLVRWIASALLIAGTALYVLGYLAHAFYPSFTWLVPLGALLNLGGFGVLAYFLWRFVPGHADQKAVVSIFCVGMILGVIMGWFSLDSVGFPQSLGDEYGVQQRMLRLARVAATALSVVTLLYWRGTSTWFSSKWAQRGRTATLIGVIGMPTILAAAAFIKLELKYLLPIPALAMTFAVVVALWESRTKATKLEQYGWLLLVISINIGLLIGLYAFEGPLPTPAFVGEYNDLVRRLTRLGHAYAIVFGLLAIIFARLAVPVLASWLLFGGSVVALLAITVFGFIQEPAWILAVGPILLVASLLAAWRWPAPSGW